MNNLVYFRGILVWSVIVIVSWAIGKYLSLFLRSFLVGSMIVIVSLLLRITKSI